MSLFSNDMRVANTATPSFAKEANVGQFGWTSADAAQYNQLIQYVDECRKIWINLEEKIEYVENILQDVQNIDEQVKYIEVMTNEVSKWRNEVISIRDQMQSLYDRVLPLYEDFTVKYPEIVQMYTDIVPLHKETIEAHHGALVAEEGAKEWHDKSYDLYLDLKEGQVYRGTWDPTTNTYPDHQGTNSVWDVILPTGTLEHSYGGFLWRSGDRLLYVVSAGAYQQLATGSGVASINGKVGAVTLDSSDVGAVSKSGDISTGRFEWRELQGTKGWPNATNSDGNNYINRAITSINPGNNGLHIFGDDAENRRRMGIQAGHAAASYATSYGILELNPYGGEVRANGSRVLTTTYLPTPSQVGAVSKSGDTMTGGLVLEPGNNARLTVNNNYVMGSNNGIIMRDHGNGNVTLSGGVNSSGAAGNLYLGYNASQTGTAGFNTNTVRLEVPLTWQASHTLVDVNGKINVDHVTNAVKKTGDEMSGQLSVFQNNTTKVKLLAGTTSGVMLTDNKDVQKWYSYYDPNTSEYRVAEYANGAFAGARLTIGTGGNTTLTGTHNTLLTLNSSNAAGSTIMNKKDGINDWYVGRANAAGDVALSSYTLGTAVVLRTDRVEFNKNPMYGAHQIYHGGSKQPNLQNSGEYTGIFKYDQPGLSQFYTGGSTSGVVPNNYVGVGIHMLRNTTAGNTSSDQAASLFVPNTGENTLFFRNSFGGTQWNNANGWGTIMMTKPLAGRDLNALADSLWHGEWYQDASANATVARNYPTAEAGKLSVTGGAYGAMQEYTSYSTNRKFVRGKSASGTASWLPWKEVGSYAISHTVTWVSGWSNYGSGYQGAAFHLQGNTVTIAGLVTPTADKPATSAIIQLPSGMRPSGRRIFNCPTSVAPGFMRVDVGVDGNVVSNVAIPKGGWISLEGITFVIF